MFYQFNLKSITLNKLGMSSYSSKLDDTYISEGHYPNLLSKGINRPECGAGVVPIIQQISHNPLCFKNKLSDIILRHFPQVLPLKPSTRIFAGTDADQTEGKFTVYIRYFGYDSCTGALITFNWVLTAAHCYVPQKL